MNYKHTQPGYLILVVLLVIALLYRFILAQADLNLPVFAIMTIILFILASFSSLTVSLDKDNLRIRFGYGLFSRRFALKDIRSAKTIRNHWYYGWGIRFWPRMWIFNASGLDAVELVMKNRRIYRIGTDEPDNLRRAVIRSIR